jgi:hypothetical protein
MTHGQTTMIWPICSWTIHRQRHRCGKFIHARFLTDRPMTSLKTGVNRPGTTMRPISQAGRLMTGYLRPGTQSTAMFVSIVSIDYQSWHTHRHDRPRIHSHAYRHRTTHDGRKVISRSEFKNQFYAAKHGILDGGTRWPVHSGR